MKKLNIGASVSYKTTTMQKKTIDDFTTYSDPDEWLVSSIYSSYDLEPNSLKLTMTNYRPSTGTNLNYTNNIIGMNNIELSMEFPMTDLLTLSTALSVSSEKYKSNNNMDSFNYNEKSVVVGMSMNL